MSVLNEYTLTPELIGNSKLLLTISKHGEQIARAIVPMEMWENEDDLKDIIKGLEHMKRNKIGAAFFNGRGGRDGE